MIDFIGEMLQDRGIRKARDEAEIAKASAARFQSKAARQNQEIMKLKREVSQLALVCQALWELTRDQAGLSDQDIQNKIKEVDGRDGKIDGRMST